MLEEFEQDTARAAAGLLQTDVANVLAGNSHNTLELASLFNKVFTTPILATPVPETVEDPSTCDVMLTLHVWNGHVYVLTDDMIGVFCNEAAAIAVLSHQWPPLHQDEKVLA
jgi:hypothetical protein